MKQQLSAIYSFAIEPYKERLRLVVFKNEEEFVCRKENRKNLMSLLSNRNEHLFKGRLQLIKTEKAIAIQVKGEIIGELDETDFQKLLENI